MLLKTYVVTKQYFYIAKGTILSNSVTGDYFIPMNDEDFLRCRIIGRPFMDAWTVENDTEHFREITGQPIPEENPHVYKIPVPSHDKWPGALVVSEYKVITHYGSIPASTIFQLGTRLTVNKPMKTVPCSGCGVAFSYTFKGSRERFLKNFYFISLSNVPLTQAILLGDNNAAKE